MQKHLVKCLLMGGQACVLYGGAEFSRDTDLAILASEENAERLQLAMLDLEADVIAVPPFLLQHLNAGHAVHFRCRHPDAVGMRVDVMSQMRGVADFPAFHRITEAEERRMKISRFLLSLHLQTSDPKQN